MGEKKTKNVVIIALCLTLIFMGVGFAVLSQNLEIKTEGTISSSWDVHYDSFVDNTAAGITTEGNEGVSKSVTLDDTKHVATLKFNLVKPGDAVQFKGVIKNYGSIKALLSTYNWPGDLAYVDRTVTINGTEVQFDRENGFHVTAPANLVLNQNDTAEVIVTYTYTKTDDNQELPEFNTDTDGDKTNDAYAIQDTLTFGFVQK